MVNLMCQLNKATEPRQIWSNIIVDISVKVFFDHSNIVISRVWLKQIILHSVSGPHQISCKTFRAKRRLSWREEHLASMTAASAPPKRLQPAGLPWPFRSFRIHDVTGSAAPENSDQCPVHVDLHAENPRDFLNPFLSLWLSSSHYHLQITLRSNYQTQFCDSITQILSLLLKIKV